VPYLSGGVSIAVLAIGSTAPGLLQVSTAPEFFLSLTCTRRSRKLLRRWANPATSR